MPRILAKPRVRPKRRPSPRVGTEQTPLALPPVVSPIATSSRTTPPDLAAAVSQAAESGKLRRVLDLLPAPLKDALRRRVAAARKIAAKRAAAEAEADIVWKVAAEMNRKGA